MQITFRARLPHIDASAASSALGRLHLRVAERSAIAFRAALVRRHQQGIGSTGPYPRNNPAYRAAKIRDGYSGRPGNRTGRLGTLEAWRIERIRNGWAVLPPEDRVDAVKNLKENHDYKIGVTQSDVEETKRIRTEELENYNVRSFTRMRSI